uniref:Uncharacterized protein n=1 Tax=Haemonchus contortus TaxID=6289 RepID=W6NTB3_HAECO
MLSLIKTNLYARGEVDDDYTAPTAQLASAPQPYKEVREARKEMLRDALTFPDKGRKEGLRTNNLYVFVDGRTLLVVFSQHKLRSLNCRSLFRRAPYSEQLLWHDLVGCFTLIHLRLVCLVHRTAHKRTVIVMEWRV